TPSLKFAGWKAAVFSFSHSFLTRPVPFRHVSGAESCPTSLRGMVAGSRIWMLRCLGFDMKSLLREPASSQWPGRVRHDSALSGVLFDRCYHIHLVAAALAAAVAGSLPECLY